MRDGWLKLTFAASGAVLVIAAAMIVAGCDSARDSDSGGARSGSAPRAVADIEVTPGATVAYLDAGEIWITDLDGQRSPVRLTDARGSVSDIEWSSDGRQLAYLQERPGTCCNEVDDADYVCCPDVHLVDFERRRDSLVVGNVKEARAVGFDDEGEVEWGAAAEVGDDREGKVDGTGPNLVGGEKLVAEDGRELALGSDSPATILRTSAARSGGASRTELLGTIPGPRPTSTFHASWIGDVAVFVARFEATDASGYAVADQQLFGVDDANGKVRVLVPDMPSVELLEPTPDETRAVAIVEAAKGGRELWTIDTRSGSTVLVAKLESLDERSGSSDLVYTGVEIAPLAEVDG